MTLRKSVLAHAIVAAGTIGAVTFAMQADSEGAKRFAPERDMPQMNMQEAMQAWQESMKLTKPHGYLKPFVGQWDTTMSIWMEGPDGPAMETAGTAEFKLVLGGRFARQTYTSSFMGQPYEGIGYTGYDNLRKQFTSTWISNMGTAIMSMKGNLDPTGRVMTQIGMMDEPMTGEWDKAVQWVTTWVDDDTFTFTAIEILYGEPFKVFEMEYRRKG